MPPTDPAEAFDDFILSHIFSFLPAREIIRTGYNVSPSWWRFYKRSRICRKLYLALENVDPAEKARVMYLPPGDVDWRMPCYEHLRHEAAWSTGQCALRTTPINPPPTSRARGEMSGFDRHTATIVSQYYARHGEAESKGALALFDAQTLAPRSIIPSDDEVFGRTLSVNIIGHLLLQADDKGETDDEEPVKIFVADHAAEQFGCATPAAAAPAGKRQPALPPTFHLLAEVILPKARYIQERAFHVDQDADGTLSLMVATGVGSVTYVDGMNVMEPVTMEIQCIARSRPGPDGKRVAVPPTECPAQSIAVGTVVGEKYDYGKYLVMDDNFIFRHGFTVQVYSRATGQHVTALTAHYPMFPWVVYDWRASLRASKRAEEWMVEKCGAIGIGRKTMAGIQRTSQRQADKNLYQNMVAVLHEPWSQFNDKYTTPDPFPPVETCFVAGDDLVIAFKVPVLYVIKNYAEVLRGLEGLEEKDQQLKIERNTIMISYNQGAKGDFSVLHSGTKVAIALEQKIRVYGYDSLSIFDTATMRLPTKEHGAFDITPTHIGFPEDDGPYQVFLGRDAVYGQYDRTVYDESKTMPGRKKKNAPKTKVKRKKGEAWHFVRSYHLEAGRRHCQCTCGRT